MIRENHKNGNVFLRLVNVYMCGGDCFGFMAY